LDLRDLTHSLIFSTSAALLVGRSLLEEGERLGNSGSTHSARAALNLGHAVGVLADKLALRLGAGGLVALPVASGLLADSLALGLGGLAVGNTVRLFADCDALGAVKHFAALVGALDFAFRFFAFDIADCVFRFRAGGVALGGFADWVADRRAMGIVALP
jgi:hypothetical protein